MILFERSKLALAMTAALASSTLCAAPAAQNTVVVQQENITANKRTDITWSKNSPGQQVVVEFKGNNNYSNATGGNHGVYIHSLSKEWQEARPLDVIFKNGSDTSVTVENTLEGDTGILIGRDEGGQYYGGSVNFTVEDGASLTVKNNVIGTPIADKPGVTRPVADAIEIRVQEIPNKHSPNVAPGPRDLNVNLQGKTVLTTVGGAGLFLLQGGSGNINAELSDKVVINANGTGEPLNHLANHGINAVVKETISQSDVNPLPSNKGNINIHSAAAITVKGTQASAIYARNLHGDIAIETEATHALNAEGKDSHGIHVRASNGTTTVVNRADLLLNKMTQEGGTQHSGAKGINVEIQELMLFKDDYEYKKDPNEQQGQEGQNNSKAKDDDKNKPPYKGGDGTGTVSIVNAGKIEAYGEESKGIRVNRHALKDSGLSQDQAAIVVHNEKTGEINLHKDKTVGIDIHNESISEDRIYIQNDAKLSLIGNSSKGIHVTNHTGLTPEGGSRPAVRDGLTSFNPETALGVWNTGDMALQGNESTGIEIDNHSALPSEVVVYNEGWLDIAGDNATGIKIHHKTVGRPFTQTASADRAGDAGGPTAPNKPEPLPPLQQGVTLGVWNANTIHVKGNQSKGIEIKNESPEKEDVVVGNAGDLILEGGSTTGIGVDNQNGDVFVSSQGAIAITKPPVNGAPLEGNGETNPIASIVEGKTHGIKAVTQNGSVMVLAEKPNNGKDFSLKVDGADGVRGIMGWVQGGKGRVVVHNDKNVEINHGSSNIGIAAIRQQGTGAAELKKGWIDIVNHGDVTMDGATDQSAGIVGWNDLGCTTIWAEGSITMKNASYASGIAGVSHSGNTLILTKADGTNAPTSGEKIDISGNHLAGIYAEANGMVNHGIENTVHGNGANLNEKPQGGAAGVLNTKDIIITGTANKGIDVKAEKGNAYILNKGTIAMTSASGEDGSVGLRAMSDEGSAFVSHDGDIRAENLKYGIRAKAGDKASVWVKGNITVTDTDGKLSDSFALKLEGMKGNLVMAEKNITGTQAIKVSSGDTAQNLISLRGTVKATNGYAMVLDTVSTPAAAAATGTEGEGAPHTTVINNAGATLYGRISGKNTADETLTMAYENRLPTTVVNMGSWVIGHEGKSANGTSAYDTTILGTSGRNTIVNHGGMYMDPSLKHSVTWNQMGVKTFANQGVLDLSSNEKAGDWLTITNSTDVSTNYDRRRLDEGTAAYYHIADRTHSDKFDGEFISNGGHFRLDVNLGDDNTGFADVLIVDNVRLEGAPTVLDFTNRRDEIPVHETPLEKGIEVVHVRGTERNDANAFVLGTTLTLNGYQYILEQDAEDKNWYIRNYMQESGSTAPLVDPNAGAYLAGAWLNARVFNHTLHDRRDSAWNQDRTVWARIEHNDGSARFFNDTQRSNLWSNVVQAGADLYHDVDIVSGVFAAFGRTKADNHSPATNTTGRVRSDGYQVGAYWTYLPEMGQGFYTDIWAYYAWFENKLTGAAVNGNTVKYDSDGFAGSVEVGYSWQPRDGRFTIQPHAQAIFSHFDADPANVEGTVYGRGCSKGWQTRVGARMFYDSVTTPKGVKLTPMLEANWLYNDVDDTVIAGTKTLESQLGHHVGEVKLGWQGSVSHDWTSWGHVGIQRGADHFRNLELQLGVGYKF